MGAAGGAGEVRRPGRPPSVGPSGCMGRRGTPERGPRRSGAPPTACKAVASEHGLVENSSRAVETGE